MTYTKFTPTGLRVCVIKVFSYDKQVPKGIVENPCFKGAQPFSSLTELLLLMEGLFDEIGNPQRSMEYRGISANPENCAAPADEHWDGDPIATFMVDVTFRHNASWQGCFVWTDKMKDTTFRSALEFIAIFDGALDSVDIKAVS